MAFKYKIKNEMGVAADYWAVIGLPDYSRFRKFANVRVGLFVNKEAREEGSQPLQIFTYAIENVRVPVQKEVPLTLEEKKLVHPEFNDEQLDAMIINHTVIDLQTEINYFDDFQKLYNEGKWQEGAYNFLRVQPSTKDAFAEAETI